MILREKQFFLSRLDDEFEVDVAYKAVIEHRKKYNNKVVSEFDLAPKTIRIDKGLSLYKQVNANHFYCRVTLPRGYGDIRKSTGKTTVQEASIVAAEIRAKTLASFEAGTLKTQTQNTWGQVCLGLIHELNKTVDEYDLYAKKETEKGTPEAELDPRPPAKDYLPIIKMLLEFSDWKKRNIKEIEYPELAEMKEAFNKEDLAKTTATKRQTGLKMIFEFAIRKRLIVKKAIPQIPNFDYVAGDDRPPFDIEDRDILMDNFHKFLESSRKNKITIHKRKLLPLYFNLLITTGMRTGKEVMALRWNALSIGTFTVKGKRFKAVSLSVTSGKMSRKVKRGQKLKKESREFLIDSKAATTLEQLYYLQFGNEKTIHEIIEEGRNEIMFAGVDGSQPALDDSFRQYNSYLKKQLSRTYTLYSARHEFINVKIEEGMEPVDIAALCGNSIATIEQHYMKFRAMNRASRILSDDDIKKFNPDIKEEASEEVLELVKNKQKA